MSREVAKLEHPAARRPQYLAGDDAESNLNIAVVFTAVEPTLATLNHAGTLASNLGARISLLVPQAVPYPLPLSAPPVSHEFERTQLLCDRW